MHIGYRKAYTILIIIYNLSLLYLQLSYGDSIESTESLLKIDLIPKLSRTTINTFLSMNQLKQKLFKKSGK